MADLVGERYEPLEVIARSDTGETVRALDHLSGRQVVLHVRHLLSELEHQSRRAAAQSLMEASAHPGLARVREEFSLDDSHYVVSDWVEGRALSGILREAGRPGLPFDEVMGWLADAAAALDHLHHWPEPAVHGKVTPSHLILPAGGPVVLVGLGDPSQSGPAGPWGPDPASDICGLAATAHVLLTGSPPGAEGGGGIPGLSDADADAVRRALGRALDGPAGRPPAASALVADLRAAADTLMPAPDEPARAQPPTPQPNGAVGVAGPEESSQAAAKAPAPPVVEPDRYRHTIRSNRLRGWVAAVLAALLLVTLLQVRAAQADREESRRLQLASVARALAAQVGGVLAAGGHEQAALMARQAQLFDSQTGGIHEREVERALRSVLTAPNFSRPLRGFDAPVTSVAISPDGRTLAAGSSAVRLFDLERPGQPVATLTGHPGTVSTVAFHPTGGTLATGGDDPGVRLWDLSRTGATPAVLGGHAGPVTSLAFGPTGRRLATAGRDGTVRLWDLATQPAGAVVLSGHAGTVTAVAFSPDGTRLASGGDDGQIQVWDVADPAAVATLPTGATVPALAFSTDGQRLAAGAGPAVLLWNLDQPDGPARSLDGHSGPVRSVAFSPDGTTLASAGADGTIRLWPAAGDGSATVLPGHRGPATSVAFSPDGRILASGSADRTARLWRLGEPDGDTPLRSENVTTAGLAALVCEEVGRNLTREEWAEFVGPGVGYRRTCPDLPAGA